MCPAAKANWIHGFPLNSVSSPKIADRTRNPDGLPRRRRVTGSTEWPIAFYPDGTADAARLMLRDREGFRLALRINPITARVHIVEMERE